MANNIIYILLARSVDVSVSENERTDLIVQAARILAKQQIIEHCNKFREDRTYTPTIERDTFKVKAPHRQAKSDLLEALALVFGCKVVHIDEEKTAVFGYKKDLEALTAIYATVLVQANYALSLGKLPKSWMFDYVCKTAKLIAQSVIHGRREVERSYNTVLVDFALQNRDDFVDKAKRQAYPTESALNRR